VRAGRFTHPVSTSMPSYKFLNQITLENWNSVHGQDDPKLKLGEIKWETKQEAARIKTPAIFPFITPNRVDMFTDTNNLQYFIFNPRSSPLLLLLLEFICNRCT
jgi:hypothetical protein